MVDDKPEVAIDDAESVWPQLRWPVYYRFVSALFLCSVLLCKSPGAELITWFGIISLVLLMPGIGMFCRSRWAPSIAAGLDCTLGALILGMLIAIVAAEAYWGFRQSVGDVVLEIALLVVAAFSLLECIDLLRASKASDRSFAGHLCVAVFSLLIGVQLGMPL